MRKIRLAAALIAALAAAPARAEFEKQPAIIPLLPPAEAAKTPSAPHLMVPAVPAPARSLEETAPQHVGSPQDALRHVAAEPDGGRGFDGRELDDPRTPEEIFAAARPESRIPANLTAAGLPFHLIAAQLAHERAFGSTLARPDGHLAEYADSPRMLFDSLREIDAYAASADHDPSARPFSAALAKIIAPLVLEEMKDDDAYTRKFLPARPAVDGEYWDLASGPNGARAFFADPATRYRLIDASHYVVSLIETVRRLIGGGRPNVVVEKADILKLERPARPLAAIRAKNITTYVAGAAAKLEAMTDWLAPGGQLILQTDIVPAQSRRVVQDLGPMIERLIAAGWRFDLEWAQDRGADMDLDTLRLTRPKDGEATNREKSLMHWAKYRALGPNPSYWKQ